MKFFSISDPFGDAPPEVRRQALREAGARARTKFDTEYPKLAQWFEAYDPLYILSFCAFYFMTSERGIDREALEGKIDFGFHHLELLQAFALMRPRLGAPTPLLQRAEELKTSVKEITDALAYAQFDFPEQLSDVERKKRMVLSQMRGQTSSIRNWAFPEQTARHLQALFSGRLAEIISTRYGGAMIGRLIDVMGVLAALTDLRLNDHFHKVRAMATAKDLEAVCTNYEKALPGTVGDRDQMRRLLNVWCGGELEALKSMLMVHSDLFLPHAFVFSLEDVLNEYGEGAPRDGIAAILSTWSHAFGELASADPKHFLYSNPVLSKPLVRLPRDPRFPKDGVFWVLGLFGRTRFHRCWNS